MAVFNFVESAAGSSLGSNAGLGSGSGGGFSMGGGFFGLGLGTALSVGGIAGAVVWLGDFFLAGADFAASRAFRS